MLSPRLAISCVSVLALAACAPSDGEQNESKSRPPIGFELAVAGNAPASDATAQVVDLTIDDLRAKLDQGNVRLIDVRTDEEVAEGMIPGAEHIALDTFDPASLDLSDGREVVLYCRSGRRSTRAGEALAAHTGNPAQHLAGGIIAWVEAGQPVEKP